MKRVELKITPIDLLLIIAVAVLFSSSISTLIYKLLDANWQKGLTVGSILGFCLAFFSIVLITINNRYILPKINKPYIWWFISAFFAFLAGYLGFYLAFFLVRSLSLLIPESILINIDILAIFSGFLNYLVGLIIYFFVSMKSKKQELENLISEGRLLSLNTQLNSHFLHNVLNNIAELIRIDNAKAEEALIKLSRFFRKVLKEGELIEISEELENVRNYIELENLRYNGLINLNILKEEKVKNIQIPRFSIQLLVENAIKHGFTGRALNINISFDVLDSLCLIRVANDGKKIEDLKFGIGLTNLSKRLKLLCKGKVELGEKEKNEFIIKLLHENFNCR